MTGEAYRKWEILRRRRRTCGEEEDLPARAYRYHSNRAGGIPAHGVQPTDKTAICIREQRPGVGAEVVGGQAGCTGPAGPARLILFFLTDSNTSS